VGIFYLETGLKMELTASNTIKVERLQILIFRSTIDNAQKAKLACCELMKIEGVHHANVDLEDWENILRVECDGNIHAKQVEDQIARLGFECFELED
jgi:hypothetical protein